MTIQNTQSVWQYNGTTTTGPYAFTTKVLRATDLVVTVLLGATHAEPGTTTTLTLNALTSGFTVAGAGNEGGGSITTTESWAASDVITISRIVPLTQTVDLTLQGAWNPETIEDALDESAMGVIQIDSLAQRAVRLSVADAAAATISTELPAPIADNLLGWNESASALENKVIVDAATTPISAWAGSNVVDVASAVELLANLNFSSLTADLILESTVSGFHDVLSYTAFVKSLLLATDAANARSILGIGTGISNGNALINGNFEIWQRNTTFSAPTQHYTADRWKALAVLGAGSIDVDRVTDAPDGSQYALKVTVAGEEAAPGAGALAEIYQSVEGFNAQQFRLGTATATEITISFWAKVSSAGNTYSCGLSNDAGNQVYVAEFTPTASWAQYTFTADARTTGTWLTDTGRGLRFFVNLLAGDTYDDGTHDTWGVTDERGTANTDNFLETGSLGNEFYLGRVQVEAGSAAGEFDYKAVDKVLEECQRYYQKSYDLGVNPGTITDVGRVLAGMDNTDVGNGPNREAFVAVRFPTRMRDTPSVASFSPSTGNGSVGSPLANGKSTADIAATITGEGNTGFGLSVQEGASLASCWTEFHYTADAELL